MEPITYIRTKVFHMKQAAFAEVAGVRQATVSRWENRELHPDRENMDRIRAAALERGVAWDDRWFFEAPADAELTE